LDYQRKTNRKLQTPIFQLYIVWQKRREKRGPSAITAKKEEQDINAKSANTHCTQIAPQTIIWKRINRENVLCFLSVDEEAKL
jgi:hypothetical protein